MNKGNRKTSITLLTGCFLLLGLLVVLVASGWFKLETSVCVQAYAIFAAGFLGKDTVFMWSNAKEHQHAATAAVNQPKP